MRGYFKALALLVVGAMLALFAVTPAVAYAPRTAYSGNCDNVATETTYNEQQNATGSMPTTNNDPCTFSGDTTSNFNFNITHSTVNGLPWCTQNYENAAHPTCVDGLEMNSYETFYNGGSKDELQDGNIQCSNGFGDDVEDYATFNLGPTTFTCSGPIAIGNDNGPPTWVEVDLNELVAVATTGPGNADGNYSVATRYIAPISAGPSAGFTITPPSSGTTGYSFTSTSSTAGTDPLSYSWTSSDGGSSTVGPTWSHVFTSAGQHTVTLTVTDSIGRTSSITQAVETDNLLNDAIVVTAPDGSPLTGTASAIGQNLLATVTVTAPATNSNTITGLAADPPLTVTPAGSLMFVSGPSPSSIDGTSLAPGQSFTYSETFTIEGTGHAGLSVITTGTAGDESTSGTATTNVALAQPLSVKVVWLDSNGDPLVLKQSGQPDQPNTLQLSDNDSGEIADSVTAEVTVTNISSINETNVSVNGTPTVSYHNPAQAIGAVPAGVVSSPQGDIGTLTPGQTSDALDYPINVSANGVFDFDIQVLSSDANTDGTNASSGTGTVTALASTLLYFDVDQASIPDHVVTSGDTVTLTGTIQNRSRTQSLDIDPIDPTVVGNAGGADPSDDSAQPLADGYTPVVAGVIKPGQTIDFSAPFVTAEDGGTRATFTYAPEGNVVNDDGSETKLSAAQIRIGSGSSQVVVHIDDQVAQLDHSFATLADGFTRAFTTSAASWLLSNFNGAKELVTSLPTSAGKAARATASAALQLAEFQAAVEYNVTFWAAMDDKERQAFKDRITGDVDASVGKLSDLNAQMGSAISSYFDKISNAYYTGDWHTLGTEAGNVAGSGLPEVCSALLTDATFEAVGRLGAKTAEGTISLAQKIRESNIVKNGVKTIAGLKEGDNLLAKGGSLLSDLYGIGARETSLLRYWAEERGLLISVRSRNPESLKWIEKFKAVVKPEILKIKNVDGIDTKFLGYLPDDLGSVVFAKPIEQSEVASRMVAAGLDDAQQKAVLTRYDIRVKEYKKYRETYEDYNKAGKVNIGFDINSQGIVGPKEADYRRFKLDQVDNKQLLGHRPSGTGPYYRVELGDTGGTLRRVTGDIDVVAITKANGEILDAGQRALVYQDLQKAIGMQHGETLSWLLNGDFLFDTKADLLADHLPGGELLAVFGPDGSVRAASIDAGMTIFNTTTNSVVVKFNGAYSAFKPAYERYASIGLGAVGIHENAVNPIPNGE